MVLLAFLLPVAGLAGGLAPAAALPQDGDPILVEIGGITPLVPTTADSLTVTGTITNRSDQRVRDLQALLRVSPEPLRSRSAVAAVTDLTTPRRGVTQPETLTPVTPELAPGSSAPFSITVATSDLPLGGNGVYALFAEARSPDVGSFDTAIPLPWFPRPQDVQPSRIVLAAPLRAPVDLPAQSGSNDMLKAMRRGYTVERYKKRIEQLWQKAPDIELHSDFIVGYPGETEADHQATMQLMEELRFAQSYIFKYSPRPGTLSAELLDDVPEAVKNRRNQELLAVQEVLSAEKNQAMVGQTVEVLVEGPSKVSGRLTGRTAHHRLVHFAASNTDLFGQYVPIKVTEALAHSCVGELLPYDAAQMSSSDKGHLEPDPAHAEVPSK